MHHAGNSLGIVDGASLMLISSAEAGAAQGMKPRARIHDIDKVFLITDPEEAMQLANDFKAVLRRIELCGKPVAAAPSVCPE